MTRTKILAAGLGCFLLLSCGGTEEPAPGPQRQAGAGQIFTADPALDSILPADVEVEKIAGGFLFTEGPLWVDRVWEGQPFLLFSDVRGNAIHRWNPETGEVGDFKKPVFEGEFEEGRLVGPNGLALDAEGNLLVCEHGNRRISKVTPDGEWSAFVQSYEGKKLNSPNDLVWHNDWLYFTDPPYGLPGQDEDEAKQLDFNGIFRVSADGETLELLDSRQTRPNGLGFSPDGNTLYVANSDPEKKMWMAYQVRADGTLGLGRTFYDVTYETAEGMPDGLTLDQQGNIYATGPGGVWILDPQGKHLGTIQPEEIPANVAWGDGGSTLYMTARSGVYRIKLASNGLIQKDPAE